MNSSFKTPQLFLRLALGLKKKIFEAKIKLEKESLF